MLIWPSFAGSGKAEFFGEMDMDSLLRCWGKLFSLLLLLAAFSAVSAQTETNHEALAEYAARAEREAAAQRSFVQLQAYVLGIPVRFITPGGGLAELRFFHNGEPIYYATNNLDSAKTINAFNVWPGGSAGLSLTGSGVTLGIWDVGWTRTSHVEFGGRATQIDSGGAANYHPTHVAGTMVGQGTYGPAKGMAPEATLHAYDWNSDLSEMATAAAAGLKVSNHSYGLYGGWQWRNSAWYWYGWVPYSVTEDYKFGIYYYDADDYDDIHYNAPYYQMVRSAGNHRDDGPSSQPASHLVRNSAGNWTWDHATVRDIDGGIDGYDSIPAGANAKNIITVGAVESIASGYTGPSDVVMSVFSSWGPTDDGRIKPDIVANGTTLVSAYYIDWNGNGSYDDYASASGTSMATPSVSGSLGLLIGHYRTLNGGADMRAATLKGVALHTTNEAGAADGPDYSFGWGLMNVEAAAAHITEDVTNDAAIQELEMADGGTYTDTFTYTGSGPIKATLIWTDLPATLPPQSLDPPDLMLVNDLDIRIIKDGATYFPWVLDPANPANPPTTGDNFRDNVEQVVIGVPESGSYTVTVTHKGSLEDAPQAFSLLLTGLQGADAEFSGFEINPAEISFTDTATGTITLDGPAPSGGLDFNPESNGSLSMPGTVTVPAGQTSADFVITPTTGAITSSLVYSVRVRQGGVNMGSDTIKITPVLLDSAEFQGEPDAVTGGYDAILDLTLNGPAPVGGISVTFVSSNTNAADSPAAAVIPEGETALAVTVSTKVVLLDTATRVTASQVVTGSWTRSVNDLTDVDKHDIELTIDPLVISWTDTSTGTVTIPSPAPTGGVAVFPRTGTGVSMPNSVTIPEGATSADFTITPTVGFITSTTVYRIRLLTKVGTLYPTVEDAYIYIKPLLMTGVVMSPDTVTGGDSSMITVTMNGPAPAGGYLIDLYSSNPAAATVQSTATIPEGNSTIGVTVNSLVVGASTSSWVVATQTLPVWGTRGYGARLYVNP
jgi:hypothetical protein